MTTATPNDGGPPPMELNFERTGKTFTVYELTGAMVGERRLTRTLFDVRCAGNDPESVNSDLIHILWAYNASLEMNATAKRAEPAKQEVGK